MRLNHYLLLLINYILLVTAFPKLLFGINGCLAKKVSGTAALTGIKTEHTVSKFAFSPGGQSKVKATFTSDKMYVDERSLKMYLFSDENWSKAKKAPSCVEKTKLAALQKSITFSYRRADPSLKKDPKTWTTDEEITILNHSDATRPTYWYITIADCSLEMYQHDADAPPIHYEITLLDEYPLGAYTHLPSDEQGMQKLHWTNILLSLLLALFILIMAANRIRSTEEVHFAVIILLLACGMSATSSLCEIIHLRSYIRNGIGSYTFDALSAHLEALCDASIALVLLAIAVGWTLPTDITSLHRGGIDSSGGLHSLVHILEGLRNPGEAVRGKNASGVLAICLVMTHSILAQWGRVYNEDFDCYHDLEHLPGRALFCVRLFFGFSFLLGVASLRRSSRCSQDLRTFLVKFALVGIVWFSALPLMALMSSYIIPPYKRHQLISTSAAIVQISSLSSLAWLFLAGSSASAYHKVSMAGAGSSDYIIETAGSKLKEPTFKIGKMKVRID